MSDEQETPEPEAIVDSQLTPEAVADKRVESLPDVSIVADRYNQQVIAAESTAPKSDPEQTRLQRELEALRALTGFDGFNLEKNGKPEKEEEPSKYVKELQAELQRIKDSHSALQKEIKERQEQAEYNEASKQVASWVAENESHFPLINEIGQQRLVFEKMWNTKNATGRMMSEAQAAREIDEEIASIVHRCAPKLGYAKREVRSNSEEPVPFNSAMSISEPVDRTKMSDDEYLSWLLRQYKSGQ